MAVSELCLIPDCGKNAEKRGWCEAHYMRWRRHGSADYDPRGEARAKLQALCDEVTGDTRAIPLSKGKIALVDADDYDWLSQHTWYLQSTPKGNLYASRATEGDKRVLMHREIVGAKDGEYVDHRDWDGLNNRRANIRVCTQANNTLNHPGHKVRASAFKGLYRHNQTGKWVASFRGKHIGCFSSEEAAARAYDEVAHHAAPEFAYLNFPMEN